MGVTPEDRTEIEVAASRLVHTFAQYVDARRVDECAELFVPDGTYRMGRHEWKGRAAIAEMLAAGYPPSVVGVHLPGTPVIHGIGEEIEVVTTFQFLERTGGSWTVALAGHYHDTLVVEPSPGPLKLRFASRVVRVTR